jgi:hypothetical protein
MSDLSGERHLFLVNSEHGEEFGQWWRTVHIPEVVANVPGIATGQIFELSPVQVGAKPTELRPYLAVYEIEGDPAAAISALHAVSGAGRLSPSPTPGRIGSTSAVYAPVTPKLTSPRGE